MGADRTFSRRAGGCAKVSERNGFAGDAAYSVFEALRPAPGTELAHMAVATYSLDLVAVSALLLSLGEGGEEELKLGPLAMVEALRSPAPRITILHEKGRLQAARRHYGVLHLLD